METGVQQSLTTNIVILRLRYEGQGERILPAPSLRASAFSDQMRGSHLLSPSPPSTIFNFDYIASDCCDRFRFGAVIARGSCFEPLGVGEDVVQALDAHPFLVLVSIEQAKIPDPSIEMQTADRPAVIVV